jgi:hypothetical protein
MQREQIEKTARPCNSCNAKSEHTIEGYKSVELQEYKGSFYCKNCLPEKVKEDIPDPSNVNEKYLFDNRELKWVISKVRLKCEVCGKPRWLNNENRWKTMCLSCYKKA